MRIYAHILIKNNINLLRTLKYLTLFSFFGTYISALFEFPVGYFVS